ncbi:MAG: protein translocase subunit SecF [Candidatus Nealsonbacteria bacterium]|nr:protein translocase subunit SecF [Candidatus Nealsonbacteria bacterium]
MQIDFIKYRKIYFFFSGILIVGSLVSLVVFGLSLGNDFTGGSLLEIEYQKDRPSNQEIKDSLSGFNLGDFNVQPAGEKGLILKMKDISEETHRQIIEKLGEGKEIKELRFESIGPVVGQELKNKTRDIVIFSLLAMLIYIAVAFSQLSWPAKSWQYALASLFILFHDILIPLGIFSLLGKYYGVQITIPIIAALLTIIGYAINNVVVVYDRLRENVLRFRKREETFEDIANKSINQTLSRQINTSLTTLLPLLFIFFMGGETLKYFALTLIMGIVAGLYSSIFLACPILVSWLKAEKKI